MDFFIFPNLCFSIAVAIRVAQITITTSVQTKFQAYRAKTRELILLLLWATSKSCTHYYSKTRDGNAVVAHIITAKHEMEML